MNPFAEEMIAIRDANSILVHVVCDTDLSYQGFLIIEKVQIRLLARQLQLLYEMRTRIKCLGNILPKGIHP